MEEGRHISSQENRAQLSCDMQVSMATTPHTSTAHRLHVATESLAPLLGHNREHGWKGMT
ncbi:hypothetical protein E2C01_027517 [Portunus trituberculatus]|uniref:Uncharacterized protein n=1 Tax=Portunus trituberculatus TaxID=210409 RepID=A0A5B7ELD7_PORTR|nr:hypothetical protein [Portunus trituberculatus]